MKGFLVVVLVIVFVLSMMLFMLCTLIGNTHYMTFFGIVSILSCITAMDAK